MTSITTGRIGFSLAALALLVAAGSCRKPQVEQCTNGVFCSDGLHCTAKSDQCVQGECGNGQIDGDEACDDGGAIDGDIIEGRTCNALCTSDETCGNGIRDLTIDPPEVCDCKDDPVRGWVCDPPEAINCRVNVPTGGCMSNGMCGNGTTDLPAEECDDGRDGNAVNSFECNSDCTTARHGDGKVNPAFENEQCDREPGTSGSDCQSPTCNRNCTFSSCGDTQTNGMDKSTAPNGEECDLGRNNGDNASCLRDCTNNICGDGHENRTNVNGKPAEGCDSGPDSRRSAVDDKDCSYSASGPVCQLCRDCQKISGVRHWCGDGTTDIWDFNLKKAIVPPEGCDQGSLNGKSDYEVCIYGEPACIKCSQSCQASSVKGPTCGDRVENGGWTDETRTVRYYEECDSDIARTCGTCGAIGASNECRNVSKAAAQGEITIVPNESLLGVTFTIAWDVTTWDPTVFEYVEPGGDVSVEGAVPVEIGADANASATNTANAIANAVTAPFGSGFHAQADRNVVTIINRTQGIRGNGPIELDPDTTPALQKVDLHGGVGCRKEQPCRDGRDCADGYYCNSSNTCKVGG